MRINLMNGIKSDSKFLLNIIDLKLPKIFFMVKLWQMCKLRINRLLTYDKRYN